MRNVMKYYNMIKSKFLSHLIVIQEPLKIIKHQSPISQSLTTSITNLQVIYIVNLSQHCPQSGGLINCVNTHKHVILNVFSSYHIGSQR